MEQKLEEIVANYRQMYAPKYDNLPARLPLPLVSEEDTTCRLLALYGLEVEYRGQDYLNDKNTNDKALRVAR